MNINRIQFTDRYNTRQQYHSNVSLPCSLQKAADNNKDIIISHPTNEISFSGVYAFRNNLFGERFPKTFFKKLVAEKIPCAYTGVEMISYDELNTLIATHTFNKKNTIAINRLKKFEKAFQGVEKFIFELLEREAKKNPKLNLQELLQLKLPSAEKALILTQKQILSELEKLSLNLPKSEQEQITAILDKSLKKIETKNTIPEEIFRRKEFLYKLGDIKISNSELKAQIMKIAEKLPQSSNSLSAFIVKYSQPYKIKINNGKIIKTPRDSEELGIRLLKPYIATDEHIHPQKLYRQEEEIKAKSGRFSKSSGTFRVSILTTARINTEKSDTLIDKFIQDGRPEIISNIQKHVNRLIQINEVWFKKGRIEDAIKLSEYIQVLKTEFDLRSNLVQIDIKKLDPLIKKLKKTKLETKHSK
ncbi:hypothetical protein HDR58_07950 [bacterium]|nr:hypothetical protein [bacterium]